MKNVLYTLAFITGLSSLTFAQTVEFKKANFKENVEEFKAVETAIKEADEFFELGSAAIFEVKSPEQNFKKALLRYERAQKLNPNNGLNNFRIGVCHIYSSSPYKAPAFIKKALDIRQRFSQNLRL